LAGVYVPSDIYSLLEIARKRCFVCCAEAMNMGCHFDESQKEGITPQEVIDKYDGIIVNRLLTLISPLIIILELRLKFIMIQLQSFTTLYEKGDFIEQVTEQLYDKADQFLADRFVIGLAQNVAMKKLWRPM
jgi:methionyl-tRNA synthetase